MISVAVQGYGIVIWDGDGEWRTYSATDSLSARLATRVELALQACDSPDTEEAVCAALLTISGAHLLAVECEHGPGGCEDDIARN